VSDVWPDWSTELDESELVEITEKNRPIVVLREAVEAVAISVSTVIMLMVIVGVLNIR
jgi:hypothetical protein